MTLLRALSAEGGGRQFESRRVRHQVFEFVELPSRRFSTLAQLRAQQHAGSRTFLTRIFIGFLVVDRRVRHIGTFLKAATGQLLVD